jgi:hypothetical protein
MEVEKLDGTPNERLNQPLLRNLNMIELSYIGGTIKRSE